MLNVICLQKATCVQGTVDRRHVGIRDRAVAVVGRARIDTVGAAIWDIRAVGSDVTNELVR